MSEVRGVAEVNGIKEYRYFAGGEWRTAENHKLFDVYRPYDRGLYARVAAGGRPEAKLAIDAARTRSAGDSSSLEGPETLRIRERSNGPH
jgi:acyl-CoA reductase-like NAD-dependent aldehyde dehydrogenase